jgi:hypothetical protein
MAIFRLSVALRTGDPGRALEIAAASDARRVSGDPHIPATWAQIKIGAAIAHLQQDSLDGSAEQATSVLSLPPEFRIATVTGWATDLDRRLQHPRFADSVLALNLREQITEFNSVAMQHQRVGEAG